MLKSSSVLDLSLYFLRPFLTLRLFFRLFPAFPLLSVSFMIFLTVPEVFNTHNTLYIFTYSSPLHFFSFSLSFPSPLFSLCFLPSLPFLSLSLPADFWCGNCRHAELLPTGLGRDVPLRI